MKKIKEFFNKKVTFKFSIMVGSIFMFIFATLMYSINKETIYYNISMLSFLFALILGLILGLIYSVKCYKKELLFTFCFLSFVFALLYGIAMFSEQMYKSTNINTEAWLNSISVLVASLIGAGISGVISFLLVSKQIKISNEAVEKQIDENKQLTRYTLEESKKETDKQNNNVALNYIYLLNAEMRVHRENYVTYLYFKTYNDSSDRDLKNIFNPINAKMWNDAKVECAKCFNNKLMQELTGYYYGVATFKELKLNDVEMKSIIRGQLTSMYKCTDMIKVDFNAELRMEEDFEIDNKKVNVNKETGKLIIK